MNCLCADTQLRRVIQYCTLNYFEYEWPNPPCYCWLASYVTVCLVHLTFSLYFWIMTTGMILAVMRLTFPLFQLLWLATRYFLFLLSTVHCRASSGRRPPLEPQSSPFPSQCPPYCLRQRVTVGYHPLSTKGNCQLPPLLLQLTPHPLRLECFLSLYGTPLREDGKLGQLPLHETAPSCLLMLTSTVALVSL